MVRKSTAIHKNNKYKIFKPNSFLFNNKNIRNACPKLPALTVPYRVDNIDKNNNVILNVGYGIIKILDASSKKKIFFFLNGWLVG
jgi:hypothetical protein